MRYRLGNNFDRAEVSTVCLGSSAAGWAVVVDSVVTVVAAALLRKALKRFGLKRRLLMAAAVVGASVVGTSVVVVVVVVMRLFDAPNRRPVLGSRLVEPAPERIPELFTKPPQGLRHHLIKIVRKSNSHNPINQPLNSGRHWVFGGWRSGSRQNSNERILSDGGLNAFDFPC